jgi:hypothetical protein
MQDVPKIVRERLRAATSAANHPDADALAAFAERSLPKRERAIVLEHLACCGDCREVVALALPTTDDVQTVITLVRRGWLTWPALRWGFAAVGVIAIAALGVVQFQRRAPMREVAKVSTRLEVPASQPPSQPASPSATAATEKEGKSLPVASSSAQAISAGNAGPEFAKDKLSARAETYQAPTQQPQGFGGVAGGAAPNQFPHGPRMPAQWQQQNARVQALPVTSSAPAKQQAADLVANRKIPLSSQMVQMQVSSHAPPVNAEAQNRAAVQDRNFQTQAQPSQPQEQLEYPSEAVGKAKAPVTVEAANVAPSQGETGANAQELPAATGNPGMTVRNLAQLSAPAPARVPQWTITSAGSLARSFDQGKTWQDVDVNAPAASATNLEAAAKTARAKESPVEKKSLRAVWAAPVFRAVAAIGAEVWAGGSGGALYHSLDTGNHWTRVIPESGGATLTADIVSLEFADAQHGKITASTAETWTTSDGGQTWQKQ